MNVNCVRDGLTPLMIATARWTIKNSLQVIEILLKEFGNEIDFNYRAKKSRLYRNKTVFEIATQKGIDNELALGMINKFIEANKTDKKENQDKK